jgi:hypothetical protein
LEPIDGIYWRVSGLLPSRRRLLFRPPNRTHHAQKEIRQKEIRIDDAAVAPPSLVTSKGLYQQERGADALVLVFVIEDGEEDAIHRGSVGEDAHWSGAPSDFAEASLDGIGGANGFALAKGL